VITMANTSCVRCGSPNTRHWRVDHHGHIKFYCDEDWFLYNNIEKPLLKQTIGLPKRNLGDSHDLHL